LDEDREFHGRVLNTRDVINLYGETSHELQQEMERSIEEYLAFCRDRDRKPDRPYSGKFIVRVPPEFRRALALTAARQHVLLNKIVSEQLARDIEELEYGATHRKQAAASP